MDFATAFVLHAVLLTGFATGQRYIGMTFANTGANAKLGCQVTDSGWNNSKPFKVTWLWAPWNSEPNKNEELLHLSKYKVSVLPHVASRMSVSSEGYTYGDFSLVIFRVERRDAGRFTCRVEVNGTTQSYVTHLFTDEELPTRKTFKERIVRANESKPVSLPCDLSNHEIQKNRGVSWFLHKNKSSAQLYFERFMADKNLYKVYRITGNNIGIEVPLHDFENNVFSLRIADVTKLDFGRYTCFVYDVNHLYKCSVRLLSNTEPIDEEDLIDSEKPPSTTSSSSSPLTTLPKPFSCPLVECLVPSMLGGLLVIITVCIVVTIYMHRSVCKDYCKAKNETRDPEKMEIQGSQFYTGAVPQESHENNFLELTDKRHNNQPIYMPMSSPVNRPTTYENFQRMGTCSNSSQLAKMKHGRAKRPRQARRVKNKSAPSATAAASAAADTADTTTGAPPVPVRHQSRRRHHELTYTDLKHVQDTVYSCITAPTRPRPGESCGSLAMGEEILGPAGGELLYTELDHDVVTMNRAASNEGLVLEDNELYGAVI